MRHDSRVKCLDQSNNLLSVFGRQPSARKPPNFAMAATPDCGYVNNTIRGKREPGASLLKAMGLEQVVQYRLLRRSR
jgi:hypothetical protein